MVLMQETIFDTINNFLQGPINWLFSAGPVIMFPVIIVILGLIFRQPLSRAVRSGILIGIGFIGIFQFVGLFGEVIGPAASAFVESTGVTLTAIDAGWGLASSITWAMPTAFGVIIICFIVNLIMLALKLTKTLDIDLWNYWAFGFTAALTYVVVEPHMGEFMAYFIAIIFAVIHSIMAYKISDWIAPCMADPENFNLPGISLPHGNAMMAPYAFAIDKVLRKIPVIGTAKADPESVQEKMGLVGEPIFIGLVIGIAIGLLGSINFSNLGASVIVTDFWNQLLVVANIGMVSAAVMYLIPKMVGVLMEGLIPLSEGIRDYITQKYPGREFIIGMDMAIIVGYPAVVAVALLMIPISLVLAIALNMLPMPFGNIVLPYADLAGMVFYSVLAVMPSKGNIIRGTISGTIQLVFILMTAGVMAPLMTAAGTIAAFPIEGFVQGATYITSLDAGSNAVHWMLILLIFPLFQMESWTAAFTSGGYMVWFVIDILWWIGYILLWYLLKNEPTRISEEKIHEHVA
ncbi:MAG: PTS transporter subunit IIC [Candidatus Hodarchaeales archaeon]